MLYSPLRIAQDFDGAVVTSFVKSTAKATNVMSQAFASAFACWTVHNGQSLLELTGIACTLSLDTLGFIKVSRAT